MGGEPIWFDSLHFLVLLVHVKGRKKRSREKERKATLEVSRNKVYETILTSYLFMCVLGNPNSSINVFLVGLSWVLWFVLNWFCFGRKFSGEEWQKCPIFVSNPMPLRLGDLRLGEPETIF